MRAEIATYGALGYDVEEIAKKVNVSKHAVREEQQKLRHRAEEGNDAKAEVLVAISGAFGPETVIDLMEKFLD